MNTPNISSGLRQFDRLHPVDAVAEAWTRAGRDVTRYKLGVEAVRAAMPVLARALDRLAATPQSIRHSASVARRPRRCPGCHSDTTPLGDCRNLWHLDVVVKAEAVAAGAVAFPGPREPDGSSQTARDVAEFHTMIGSPTWPAPHDEMPSDAIATRNRLLAEETNEATDATTAGDLVGIADGLADLVYAAYGTAYTYGIDLDAALAEVHRSHMTKDRGPTSKSVKHSRYERPNVAGVLDRAGHRD